MRGGGRHTGRTVYGSSVELVSDGHLDFGERVQDVQLGQGEGSESVDLSGATEEDEIQPTASPPSTGGHSDLGSNRLQHVANFRRGAVVIEALRREGAGSDSGLVSLDHSDDRRDSGGRHSETSTRTANGGIRRSDIRVGT